MKSIILSLMVAVLLNHRPKHTLLTLSSDLRNEMISYDTSKIIVKICFTGQPDQKPHPGTDYKPVVCAYKHKGDSLYKFKVLSYDYIDGNNKSPQLFHVTGGQVDAGFEINFIAATK